MICKIMVPVLKLLKKQKLHADFLNPLHVARGSTVLEIYLKLYLKYTRNWSALEENKLVTV